MVKIGRSTFCKRRGCQAVTAKANAVKTNVRKRMSRRSVSRGSSDQAILNTVSAKNAKKYGFTLHSNGSATPARHTTMAALDTNNPNHKRRVTKSAEMGFVPLTRRS